jgi:polyisoprenoid-binding protein YceI
MLRTSLAAQPLSGTYRAQPAASSFAFAVRHSGVFCELTIRGVTRPVTASGHYAPPRPASFGEVAGLELHTSFDRREFGFDWQMPLPGGGDAVGWDVEVDIDLVLKRDDAEGEA